MRKLPYHHCFKHHYFFFNLKFHSLTLSKNMKKKFKNFYNFNLTVKWFGMLWLFIHTQSNHEGNYVIFIYFSCRLQSKLRLSNVSYILIFSNIEIKKKSMIYRFYLRNDLHQMTKPYVQIMKHEMFRWILNFL